MVRKKSKLKVECVNPPSVVERSLESASSIIRRAAWGDSVAPFTRGLSPPQDWNFVFLVKNLLTMPGVVAHLKTLICIAVVVWGLFLS